MREVHASDAKTHLAQLLDEVERGETLIITRHGRPVARLVPETTQRRSEIRAAIEDIRTLRRGSPKLSASEIREIIDEGRKY